MTAGGPALRLRQAVADAAGPEPQTPEQRIVDILASADAPLSQRQIRERAATRPATVASTLQGLAAKDASSTQPGDSAPRAGSLLTALKALRRMSTSDHPKGRIAPRRRDRRPAHGPPKPQTENY